MFKPCGILFLLLAASVTNGRTARADVDPIEVDDESGYLSMPAHFDSKVVERLMSGRDVEISELDDEEARALAESRGIELPAVPAGRDENDGNWGRPWFVVKAGVGLPNLLNAHVEIFVHRNWTVEVGGGWGLLPMAVEGSIRWRPDATCWGCDGRNFFSLGFGVDTLVGGTEGSAGGVALLVTASVDAMYIHRFAKHFGLVAGTRWGVGATTEFGAGRNPSHVEPALNIVLLYVGLAF